MIALIRTLVVFVGVLIATADRGSACAARDFLEEDLRPIPKDPVLASLLQAYPSLRVDAQNGLLVTNDEASVEIGVSSSGVGIAVLKAPSVRDQFRYIYPLDFDLTKRLRAWEDPGRVRNARFMEVLYFSDAQTAKASLQSVAAPSGGAVFHVTTKHGVNCQLASALEQIGPGFTKLFQQIGGSFNWRTISGTTRLSVHSFGAAVDLNSTLGGYWKWAGRPAGQAGKFDNKIPEAVVRAFERYGFIWGGKWHHFDGMHFEYRPELILYSRHLNAAKG
ncbi:MAG: M15 family metallopeptidase [Rhodobacteraceae bacterium]|nr:M15 family metallopeptidase [Paracoccaceae bacterium]